MPKNEATEPKTLREAHEVVSARRPAADADLSVWLTFRQRNASLYRQVADVDRGHHHESLYWAGYEDRKANEVAARIQGKTPVKEAAH
ncbi:AMED_5909 family protein [Amycolatopsis sp. NPDC059021]|uniref:AMED_5909 family protein n=1 Tax=Amycolatopsis sp. NPDC059021 TaxID=3346704 RepID=UPI003672FB6D